MKFGMKMCLVLKIRTSRKTSNSGRREDRVGVVDVRDVQKSSWLVEGGGVASRWLGFCNHSDGWLEGSMM